MSKFTKWRNIIGFWILGLANNYPYVVMLSAAFDTIHRLSDTTDHSVNNDTSTSNSSSFDSCTLVNGSYKERELCEKVGTSVGSVCVCVCVCVCVMREKTVKGERSLILPSSSS